MPRNAKAETTTKLGVGPRPVPRPGRPFLVGLCERTPALFAIRAKETAVGRDPDAALHLDARGVSRLHARLLLASGTTVSLLDLGARNGTFINGERIDVRELHEGDEVHFGPFVAMRFTVLSERVEGQGVQALWDLGGRLTPRELDVAQHVVQGLTNAAVAERLGLKPRTVAAHLEHIYKKAQVRSRAELTSLLARWPDLASIRRDPRGG